MRDVFIKNKNIVYIGHVFVLQKTLEKISIKYLGLYM